MRWNMHSIRTWLFRILVALSAALIVISFTMPWWKTDAVAGGGGGFFIKIYGYGLRHNMVKLAQYVAADITPVYQTVLAWVYVAGSAGLALFSAWLKGLKGRLLLGGVGLAYIAYALIAMYARIAKRLVEFNIALQGTSSSGMYRQVNIVFHSAIGTGFYMALCAGGALAFLAIFQSVITGRNKPDETVAHQ
jgi:hypothetical protein